LKYDENLKIENKSLLFLKSAAAKTFLFLFDFKLDNFKILEFN
jgi:hypothetical protein